jgi:hypothetical protein
MWLRARDLKCELRKEEILDWVEIDGTIWIEIPDGKGASYVQPNIEGRLGKNAIPVEACMEETHD